MHSRKVPRRSRPPTSNSSTSWTLTQKVGIVAVVVFMFVAVLAVLIIMGSRDSASDTSSSSSSSTSISSFFSRLFFSSAEPTYEIVSTDTVNHSSCIDGLRVPREFIFDLDKPRMPDEEVFCHLPKSRGGVLKKPTDSDLHRSLFSKVFSSSASSSLASPVASRKRIDAQHHSGDLNATLRETMMNVWKMFDLFDQDEQSHKTMPVYGTMCVGRDCGFIPIMFANLNIGIGHIIVVVNTDDPVWVTFFTALEKQFPGRFSKYHRPNKLSCAESWNLVVRQAFSIRPMIDQVFISNADWHPKPSQGVGNNMARFAEWSRTVSHLVVNRYYHFSSFSFTKKGFLELGYFDEVIYPALAEDVEFHIKAVSKGMGELGLYGLHREGSVHITRASAADKTIEARNARGARFDYIMRKWGVNCQQHRDFALARPFKNPFNIPFMHHNNSWAVDPVHRRCMVTGEGPKLKPVKNGRCYWNPHVLKDKGLVPRKQPLPDRITTDKDYFPGGWH